MPSTGSMGRALSCVRIGVEVPGSGVPINLVRTMANGSLSNLATWRVRVNGGVFSDDAFAFGKVFLGCNCDGSQSEGELGISGIHLMNLTYVQYSWWPCFVYFCIA